MNHTLHDANVTLDATIADARAYLAGLGITNAGLLFDGDNMPRYAARRDTTHAAIRDILREAGASVFDAGGVGGSFPDLVVGWQGYTFLVEVKAPGGRLSDGQERFRRDWRGGPVLTVYGAEAALAAMIQYRDATRKGK